MREIIIALVIVVIILLITFIIFWKRYDNNLRNKIKEDLLKYGKLTNQKNYFLYEINNQTYALYILRVNHQTKLTFNSKKIWEKSNKTNIKLIDMTNFSNLEYEKIVIVYPKVGPYLYYQDENNLMFTNPDKNIWDLRVISADLIAQTIPNLNNGKKM
ncbi:MAG: hypothetical protein WC907_05860 [Acholeplasmataceae bacterium]